MNNNINKTILLVAFAVLLGLSFGKDIYAVACNDSATGNWGSAGTWDCGIVPDSDDSVTIDSHTVTLAAAASVNNITISGGTLNLSSYTLSVAGNWQNQGGFFQADNSTVVFFDSSQTSQILGDNTFYNFKSVTPGKELVFAAGTLTTVQGTLTIEGTAGNHIQISSSLSGEGNEFRINIAAVSDAQGNDWVEYVTVNDSDALGDAVLIRAKNIILNNTTGWDALITVSGTAYQNDEATDVGDGVNTYNVALRVNGGTASTTTTDINTGVFSFSNISVNAGDTITIYFYGASDTTAGTYTGNIITITDGSTNISSLLLIDDHVVISSNNGATAITIADLVDYDNDQNSANLLFDAELASPNTLIVEAGNELYIMSGASFTPGGTVTANSGGIKIMGTWTVTTTESITCAGNWTNSGTFTAGTGTVTFSGGVVTITPGSDTYNNINFTANGNKTITGTLYVAGNLYSALTNNGIPGSITLNGSGDQTITTVGTYGDYGRFYSTTMTIAKTGGSAVLGTLVGRLTTLIINSGNTFDVSASSYSLYVSTLTNNGTFNARSGTLYFKNDTTETFTPGTDTYNNVSFGAVARVTISGTLYVAGNLYSALTNYGVSGSITLNGSGDQTITSAATDGTYGSFYGTTMTIAKTGGSAVLGTDVRPISTLTINANNTFNCAGYNLTSTTITNNGTFQLTGDETITVTTMTLNTGSTVEYTATSGSRAIQNWAYKSLKINGSGGIFTMHSAGEVLAENLTVSAGTFDLSDYILTVQGNTTINGGTLMTGTNTITFGDAAGDSVTVSSGELKIESDSTTADIVKNAGTWTNSGGTITYNCATGVSTTLLSSLSPYYNLTVNSSGSTYTLNGAIDVNGNLTITAGTVDTSNGNNYQINVAGNWTNSGTLTARQGTVVFDGKNQTITGSTIFFNFSKSDSNNNSTDLVLYFDSSGIQTIQGLLTFDGLDDNDRINLRSTNNGVRWGLTATNTFAIDYVDVQDSNASGGSTIQHTNTINRGNNLNWGFSNGIIFKVIKGALRFLGKFRIR